MSDLRGDLVVMVRKEDNKVTKLVEILNKRKVISDNEMKTVLALEPLART